MKRFYPVLTYAGTPPLVTFSSNEGTPIVIDNTTNKAYYNNAGTVTQIAGGGGGGVTTVTGTSPVVSSGGTTPAISLLGLSGLGTGLQVVRVNAGATALEYATAGAGSVTSVGVSSTGSTLSITGSPVTGSGVIDAEINLAHENAWTATQYATFTTLTSAATVTPNLTTGTNNFYLLGTSSFLTPTIAAPTGAVAGMVMNLELKQPASGGPVVPAFAVTYKWGLGGQSGQPTFSTAANASDKVSGIVQQDGSVHCVLIGQGGPQGAGYLATSSTSQTPASTGSFAFTTQAGLAYSTGCRARFTSVGSGAYIEGLVTSYASNILTITADTSSGSGAHVDWNINCSGNVGGQGIQGVAGPAGSGNGVNLQTGTTYTYVAGDSSKLVSHSNASAIAATLPQATGSFASPFVFDVENRGAGTLTITPTTSTIDGASNLALLTNQGCRIFSDGTNWYTQRGIGGSSVGSAHAFSVYAAATTAIPSGTPTKILFNTVEFDTNSEFASSRFTPLTAGKYQINASSQVGPGTTGGNIAIFKNGTQYKVGTYATPNGGFLGSAAAIVMDMNGSTDFIEVFASFTGGASMTTFAGQAFTYFNGHQIK